MSSEELKTILGAHFKCFRAQLEFLATEAQEFTKTHSASPFSASATKANKNKCLDDILLQPGSLSHAKDELEKKLVALLCKETGGLRDSQAGKELAGLIGSHSKKQSASLTTTHKFLVMSVLRRTANVEAMKSFLQSNGLSAIIEWLVLPSGNNHQPPANITLMQRILEWLTGFRADVMVSQAVQACIDTSTSASIKSIYAKSKKALDRCVLGHEHISWTPSVGGCAENLTKEGVVASVHFLYKQLFHQIRANKKGKDEAKSAALLKKPPPKPSSSPKKRVLEGAEDAVAKKLRHERPVATKEAPLSDAPPVAVAGSLVKLGKASPKQKPPDAPPITSNPQEPEEEEKEGGDDPSSKKPNPKVLKRSGRRKASEDLHVIVPFSSAEMGEGFDVEADTEHNSSRRKIRWADEAPDGVLSHTLEFESLPPLSPEQEKEKQAKRPKSRKEAKEKQADQEAVTEGRDRHEGGEHSAKSYSRRERVLERENALKWRDQAARQRLQALVVEARAVRLPEGRYWVQPAAVALPMEQELLMGSVEVDSKECKLQSQRVGKKVEICYFAEEDIPPDPESASHSRAQAQQQAGAVQIPWEDAAMDLESHPGREDDLDGLGRDENENDDRSGHPHPHDPHDDSRSHSRSMAHDHQAGSSYSRYHHDSSPQAPRPQASPSRTTRGGQGEDLYASFERQLRAEPAPMDATEELLSDLPGYVTMLNEKQLEVLLEKLSEEKYAHLVEDSSHPDFLELVGSIAPEVKATYLERSARRTARRSKSRFSDQTQPQQSSYQPQPPHQQYDAYDHHQTSPPRDFPPPPRPFQPPPSAPSGQQFSAHERYDNQTYGSNSSGSYRRSYQYEHQY